MFVENEVKNATPSIGYTYLTALIDQDYFNTTFTTNFDDLLNEAFFLYSRQRPIVCAHDSSINSVTVTSKRPKIIKLHGDYLFDDIKATDRETESLGQNMKEKFVEFAKDFGLIVVGYAGGDRSIIDTLSLLLKNEDYFKNGIYWCIRRGSDIPEDLRRLLWRDRVYFIEIDGFDELFASMFSEFNPGEYLPPAAIQGSDRYEGLVKKISSNPSAFPETTQILKQAKEKLLRLSKRKSIANSLVNTEEKDRPLTSSLLTDDELLDLTNLQQLQRDRKHKELIEQIRGNETHYTKHKASTQIANLLISAHLALRQEGEALQVIEQLDSTNRYSAQWILRKARLLRDNNEKLKAINEACERDDESPEAFRTLGNYYHEICKNSIGDQRNQAYNEASTAYKRSLKLEPSSSNSAWSQLHTLVRNQEKSITKRNELLNEIENQLEEQGTRSWRALSLKSSRIDEKSSIQTKQSIINQIKLAQAKVSKNEQIHYDRLLLRVAKNTCDIDLIKSITSDLLKNEEYLTNSELTLDLAQGLRQYIGNDSKALSLLRENFLNDDFDFEIFYYLIQTLSQLGEINEAESLLERYKSQIREATEYKIRKEIAESKCQYENALLFFRKEASLTPKTNQSHESYYLLLCQKFEDAKSVAQATLEKNNYSPECVMETVNYELAQKFLGKKPNHSRLDAILKFDSSPENRAVIAALMDRTKESIEAIKEIFKKDKTFRFEVARWPVFSAVRTDPEYQKLITRFTP